MSDKLIALRRPEPADGGALHKLVADCPPLDENSMYCNLLQCTHFSSTSVVADSGDALVAAVSGYRVPERENTLFVWQVAVSEPARGQGLGGRMLSEILSRPECSGVRYLETTVTASNEASWALFKGFARREGAELQKNELFESASHFNGQKPTEILVRIGPLAERVSPASGSGIASVSKEKIA
ncbi:MAG: diaminobutyrate acetyltransferase [Halioglobus sp.]|nr:diaminobutyrate acetyltransferase [Halioglobus sp.]